MQGALFAGDPVPRAEAAARLSGSGRLPAAAGLAIYRRGVILRIAGCMAAQFPALRHALGAQLFDDFVGDYVRAMPPESHTLYDLGRRFPAFLEASRPDRDLPPGEREAWIDFMVDLARFERSVFALFDAPGDEGTPSADQRVPDSRLRLRKAFSAGAYGFAVADYYHAVRLGEAAPLPPRGPSWFALVRTDYVVRTVILGAPDFALLEVMAAGGSVEDGIEAAARCIGAPAGEVRRAWHEAPGGRRRWIALGFFVEAD
jgi:hypothetical protein